MNVLILGATSAIAHETAKAYAAQGAALYLVGRNPQRLNANADDLKVAGAKQIQCQIVDLDDLSAHEAILKNADAALGGLDAALLAWGTLGDQNASQAKVDEALRQFHTNGVSYISMLTLLGNYFEGRKQGVIGVISSVAGDRGRGSNYVYGAAKGAVSLFTGGLRARLAKAGVSVVTIKPGFVDTPMTAGMKKNPLYASPQNVGSRIHKAMVGGENVVYTPSFWMLIMGIIRNIPERIFKKLSM